MQDEPKVTIVGGGLSAIYAFWGCIDAGYKPHQVQVLHNTISTPAGAVFMYSTPIPWPHKKVTSVLLGTCDGYSENQWDDIRPTSAHKRFRDGAINSVTEKLYLPEELLITLWGMIPRKAEVPMMNDSDFHSLKKKRDAVICTFSNPQQMQDRRTQGFLSSFPVYSNRSDNQDYGVLYNGLKSVPWVRQTVTPGWIHTEYAHLTSQEAILRYEHDRGNRNGKFTMAPDLHPDCPPVDWADRREGNLFRVGRFACYIPGYLSHQARGDTAKFLAKL